jgi:hypothetical protein
MANTLPLCEDNMKHWEYHPEPIDTCFGCKALGLEMNAGDARIADSGTTNKKWNKELQAYRDARAQGIQPAGTTTQAVRAAVEISNKTGKAFNADNPNG